MVTRFFLLMCTVLLADASESVRKQGKLDIHEYCSVDLDVGASVCNVIVDGDGTEPPTHPRGKAYDLWLQRNGKALYFVPQNGAVLAIGDLKEAGFQGCGVAQYAKGKIRIDDLPRGTHICVRTNEGRYAEMRLEDADLRRGRVVVKYITWEKAELVVKGKYAPLANARGSVEVVGRVWMRALPFARSVTGGRCLRR
jgi:hypothetical protein